MAYDVPTSPARLFVAIAGFFQEILGGSWWHENIHRFLQFLAILPRGVRFLCAAWVLCGSFLPEEHAGIWRARKPRKVFEKFKKSH